MQSRITFSAVQLQKLIDSGEFTALIRDGTTEFIITSDGQAVELDFSKVEMQNVKQITIGANVTLQLDQDDLHGVQVINGTGNIQAISGSLDMGEIEITITVDPPPTPTTRGPEFASTSTLAVSVTENTINITNITANDADNDTISYSPSGAGAALFNLNTSTALLSFKNAPDYEKPSDAGADNVYDLTVKATTPDGLNATRNVEITVANANEAPTFATLSTSLSVAENQTAATTITLTDAENDTVAYSLSGTDAALFNVNAGTGVITFKAEPDFEAESDADADKIYEFNIVATDIVAGGITSHAVTVTVTDGVYDVLKLSELNGTNGYRIDGVTAGREVSNVGDINSDGYDDFIIGEENGNGYAVFGKPTDSGNIMALDSLTGSNGFKIDKVNVNVAFGEAMSAAGDVNGDGFADFMVTADLGGECCK